MSSTSLQNISTFLYKVLVPEIMRWEDPLACTYRTDANASIQLISNTIMRQKQSVWLSLLQVLFICENCRYKKLFRHIQL